MIMMTRTRHPLSQEPTAFIEGDGNGGMRVVVVEGGRELLAEPYQPETREDVWHLFNSQPEEVFEGADAALAAHGWQRADGRRWVVGDVIYGTQARVMRAAKGE